MLDNARFGKFCRESRILGPGCNKRDADIIFVRVTAAAKRRKLTYPEFIHVLERIALKRRIPFTLLEATILQSGGPRLHAASTVPDQVRFHDEKSTYTGVYVNGGPSHNDVYTFMTDAAWQSRHDSDVRARQATLKLRDTMPFGSEWDSATAKPRASGGPVVRFVSPSSCIVLHRRGSLVSLRYQMPRRSRSLFVWTRTMSIFSIHCILYPYVCNSLSRDSLCCKGCLSWRIGGVLLELLSHVS